MRALGGPQEDTWTASTGPDWSPHYHLSQPGTLQARLLGDALFPGPKPLLPLPRQQQIKRAGLLDFINVTYFSMPGRSFHLTRDTFFKLHVPSGSHMAWRLRTDWGLSGSMGLRSSPHFGGPGPPLGDTQLRFQMEGGQGRSPAASSRRPRVPPAPRRAGGPSQGGPGHSSAHSLALFAACPRHWGWPGPGDGEKIGQSDLSPGDHQALEERWAPHQVITFRNSVS